MGRGTSFDLRETILLLLFVLFDTTKAAQLGCYASFLLEKNKIPGRTFQLRGNVSSQ